MVRLRRGGCPEEDGPDRTVLTIVTDIPGLDESKASFLSSMIERSVANMKSLVESET